MIEFNTLLLYEEGRDENWVASTESLRSTALNNRQLGGVVSYFVGVVRLRPSPSRWIFDMQKIDSKNALSACLTWVLSAKLNSLVRFRIVSAQVSSSLGRKIGVKITYAECDEAHCWLNGYVNKQNCRIWSEANPQVYVETPLHPEKLTELWFQQDSATCHTSRATIDLLKKTFGDRLISRFGPVNWPPRSCDLTPVDYFLWGYVKSLVYADKLQMLDHLEDNIRRVIADIRPQRLEKVIENWTSRLYHIRASRGSHMPEIIFKM
ncbi:putative DD41D transposase [Trichonephila clavipes]|nr:putative DD41D transposase [Trichonephila clavipes]